MIFKKRITYGVFALISISLILKIFLILNFPGIGGDTSSYKYVALNILNNGCISLSNPETALCVPHWGGNQLPGYPIFLAINYFFFGINDMVPRISAALIGSLAVLYLLKNIPLQPKNDKLTLLVTLVLAFSPLYFAQSRFLLTEQLTISLTIFLIAEIINSIQTQKVKLINISILFSLLFFIRYDSITLIPPLIIAIYIVSPVKKFVINTLIFFVLISLPVVMISLRHLAVDLPIFPKPRYVQDGSQNPNGYINWAKSWMYKSQHQEAIMFPLAHKNHANIVLPNNINLDRNCYNQSITLLKELRTFDGKAFPKYLDDSFQSLAISDSCSKAFPEKMSLGLRRASYMWGTVTSSFGWPTIETGLKSKIIHELQSLIVSKDNASWVLFTNTIKNNFFAILVRALANLYWVMLLSFILASPFIFFTGNDISNTFLKITLTYMLSKTIFLVLFIGTSYEIRLLNSIMPFMEISALFLIRRLIISKQIQP